VVKQGWIKASPVEAVEPVGKVASGKPLLHLAEARKFSEVAFEWYRQGKRGWEAALGCLLCLWLGLRLGEVCRLKVRGADFFKGGVYLWIEEGKTDAARRRVVVEGELVELLRNQVAGRSAEEWLFPAKNARGGHRSPTWLRAAARRFAGEAHVPYCLPHGLRGTQSSLSVEAGATSALVAQQLGHTNTRVTEKHYIRADVIDLAKFKRSRAALEGRQNGRQTQEAGERLL
jgi:integrase